MVTKGLVLYNAFWVHDSSCAVTNGCSYISLVQNVGTYTSSFTPGVECQKKSYNVKIKK